MAESSTQANEPAPAPRFQFRLRSIFILMLITAFSLGIVPAWYQRVVVQEELSQFEWTGDTYSYREYRQEVANRYTPSFCLIGFVGSCGLWYACASPTKRRSDLWIGLAFCLTLGLLLLPRYWALPYIVEVDLLLVPFDLNLRPAHYGARLTHVLTLALVYSFWPLLVKRYLAALLLFLYSCLYGVIVASYAREIIMTGIY